MLFILYVVSRDVNPLGTTDGKNDDKSDDYGNNGHCVVVR